MVKKTYICDAGGIQIDCGGSLLHISNGYGDGEFKTYLFDSVQEFEEYKNEHYQYPSMQEKNYKFVEDMYFVNGKVLNYDCFKPFQQTCFCIEREVLFELNGRFEIQYNLGKIYFIKLEELGVARKHV